MRWRLWGVLVVFLMSLVATSCRDTVDPNTDRNRPPETYLTAAPIESIAGGGLDRIPYRFHAHWSGSDIDGEVVGFFVAVTETLATLRLPPPKPQQYMFTTRTDSIIIFNVLEGFGSDREHGLYVFAVDNEGKVDPDPAYVNFVVRDRNLPGLDFLESRAEGSVFQLDGMGGVFALPFSRLLSDPVNPVGALTLPRDTIPVGGSVFFAWQGWDNDWGSFISGYKFKLMEPELVAGDSTLRSVEYDTGVGNATIPIPIGLNLFRVRSIDEAGGSTLDDSLRRFVVNFDSDTWFAGPDTTLPSIQAMLQSDGRGRYLAAADNVIGLPPPELDPWLGDGRFEILPSERKPMGTFLEKVKIGPEFRYYIRSDGDTVARNAENIFLFAGGFDRDSPYDVIVAPGQVGRGRVGVPGPANGSPIGSEFRIIKRFINRARNNPSWSVIHPSFDPLRPGFKPDVVFEEKPEITAEWFAQARSVDGNLGKDRRIRDALQFFDAFGDDMPPHPLRRLVIHFHSNFNPFFITDKPEFTPRPDSLILDANFDARLFMNDPDSVGFDPATFLVRVRFRTPGDPEPADVVGWQPDLGFLMRTGDMFPFVIPSDLTPGKHFFEFELSDQPELNDLDDRRIVRALIPFFWQVVP